MFSRIKKIGRDYKELKYLAYHDNLTGLLNRNWLYKNINEIDKKYVYFIDINGLRRVNGKGHTFGDEHIKLVIKSILLVEGEIFLRYAGDEFILFSDRKDAVITNNLVSVGFSEIGEKIPIAINNADREMIKSKRIWKKSRKCKNFS